MFCLPPWSTLFPYTTLFRSDRVSAKIVGWDVFDDVGLIQVDTASHEVDSVPLGNSATVAVGDRKSTRLNSSHGYISYAVFCLKKKKKYSSTIRILTIGTTCT